MGIDVSLTKNCGIFSTPVSRPDDKRKPCVMNLKSNVNRIFNHNKIPMKILYFHDTGIEVLII